MKRLLKEEIYPHMGILELFTGKPYEGPTLQWQHDIGIAENDTQTIVSVRPDTDGDVVVSVYESSGAANEVPGHHVKYIRSTGGKKFQVGNCLAEDLHPFELERDTNVMTIFVDDLDEPTSVVFVFSGLK